MRFLPVDVIEFLPQLFTQTDKNKKYIQRRKQAIKLKQQSNKKVSAKTKMSNEEKAELEFTKMSWPDEEFVAFRKKMSGKEEKTEL
mmetsp:Transcript_66721/g.106049  ORF Transcript_66721/g.106049 Transcript_66721/m.106049 type:complete len:86 (-) Transcript_66721:100-357(-)